MTVDELVEILQKLQNSGKGSYKIFEYGESGMGPEPIFQSDITVEDDSEVVTL